MSDKINAIFYLPYTKRESSSANIYTHTYIYINIYIHICIHIYVYVIGSFRKCARFVLGWNASERGVARQTAFVASESHSPYAVRVRAQIRNSLDRMNEFVAERKTSLGKDWHASCLRCEKCNKTLTPGGHAEHEGKPYCHNPCYSALYGPGGALNVRGKEMRNVTF